MCVIISQERPSACIIVKSLKQRERTNHEDRKIAQTMGTSKWKCPEAGVSWV
jgi:hypothetical protein